MGTADMFDVNRAYFKETKDRKLYPSPFSRLIDPHWERHFEFFGALVGKALYSDILLKCELAPFFLNIIVGKTNQVDDMKSLDHEQYESLMTIKDYTQEQMENLCLTMSFSENTLDGEEEVELVPNGKEVEVTTENRLIYLSHYANYMLTTRTLRQTVAFTKGLRKVIPPEVLDY